MEKLEEILSECLFWIAKRRIRRTRTKKSEHTWTSRSNYITSRISDDEYYAWREEALARRYNETFDPRLIEGKDVLDFGCGYGNLALWAARHGAKKVIGIDLSPISIRRAAKAAEGTNAPVEFRVATSAARIDLPDHSIDLILCFDVLEHVIEYRSIIPEWRRILRKGGKMLILWSPYYHPYGHHVQDYAPIPWMHLFVSPRIIAQVCSNTRTH